MLRGTASHVAPQHGPRPLPLFLDLLRSETAASPARRAAALAGLARYQQAPRLPRRMAPARRRRGTARLRDYGGEGPPVLIVPSLINPPYILDLAPGRSLARWLATRGHHVWLLDWGVPDAGRATLDLAGHVERVLLPLIAGFDRPPILVGYCLGGTLCTAAAAAAERVTGLATIAAPWHFAGYGGAAREEMAALWRAARPSCAALGLVPMEVLQAGFWKLDPARVIAKYERFATLEGEAAATFVAMEDWANAGAPLTYAAGADMFERFLAADDPGRGAWHVGGRAVDPLALDCPAVEFVSLGDRIVPAATAAGLADRRDLAAGHVGMVVGSGARVQLWEPLATWVATLAL